MSRNQSHYIQLDLIIIILVLTIISLIGIYNAQLLGQYPGQNFVLKQIIYLTISLGVFGAIQFLDLDMIKKMGLPSYIFGVISLIVLFFAPEAIAKPVNGAKSWFNNKVPFVSIQPSEFVKIFLIVFLAAVIVDHQKKYAQATIKSDLLLIIKVVFYTLIPVAFILPQTDLGTSIICLFIAGVMIILSGINWKVLGTVIFSSGAFIGGSLFLVLTLPEMAEKYLKIKPYQMRRVTTWFDPTQQDKNDRYHIDLSLQTVGSGELMGNGFGAPPVMLPEAHTDFIFSVIGETFGFIGGAVLILVFFLLIYKLVTLGMKMHPINPFGANICFGFMGLILIHTFQNIGMTIGIMPITGVPLLFISYGGSTILSTMMGFALVYRIAVEYSIQQDYLFKSY